MTDKIGELLDGTESKDAIHVAIYPAVADRTLHPGTPVTLRDDNQRVAVICPAGVSIGIVDPFLKAPLRPGDRFWVFINPNTITSLRHDWTHPALQDQRNMEAERVASAKQWMVDFAQNNGMNYEEAIAAARRWIDEGKTLTTFGYLDVTNSWSDEQRLKYWECIEIITGKKPPDTGDEPFSCSC